MKLSEMKQILSEEELRLTKSLGQNFLHDNNQLRRIVEAAELQKDDKVLEIGPGLGPLTELLLQEAGEVLAIETDARLVQWLEKRFKVAAERARVSPSINDSEPTSPAMHRQARLRLLHDDALSYLRRVATDWSNWKLVANLPYSVASPILVELTQAKRGPKQMVFTVQLEVAKRLAAKASDPDYGVLTLLMQLDYELQRWFKIPAGCFFPQPEIDSACVSLLRRKQSLLPIQQREAFTRIVKRGFSQRRKMMLKLLKTDWQPARLELAFAEAQLAPQVRAEKVTLQQFVQLTQNLSNAE
jgi:16S rRNA (adenine1518-N6/adenine1519-N6)-dimethyltransferase